MTKSTEGTEISPFIPPLSQIFSDIKPILVAAGEIALDFLHNPDRVRVEEKPDGSRVTNADIAVSEYLVAQLSHYTPSIAVVSEESKSHKLENPDAPYWVLDPIDGTDGFIKRTDAWAVLVALIDKRKPIFAVAYAPMRSLFYYAAEGQGAYKLDKDSVLEKLKTREWNPENKLIPLLRESIMRAPKHKNMDPIEAIGFDIDLEKAILADPLACMAEATIAEGKADFYLSGLGRMGPKEWDMAVHLIIREAGGAMITLNPPYEIGYGEPSHEFFNVITMGDARAAAQMIQNLKTTREP